jgi:hypothetical protein
VPYEEDRPEGLTRRETEKLIEVVNRYRDVTDEELSEVSHEFPEWVAHFQEGMSTPIPWSEVLARQGKTDLVPIIEEDEADRQELEALFVMMSQV